MTIIIIIIVIFYENYYSHIIISSVSQSRRLQKVKKDRGGGVIWTLCAPHRRRPRQPAGCYQKSPRHAIVLIILLVATVRRGILFQFISKVPLFTGRSGRG